MAITPNTTFVSGAVLTAAQQNKFPFGIVAQGTGSVRSTTTTLFETFMTCTGTVLANRSVKVTILAQMYGYSGGFNVQLLEGGTNKFSGFSVSLQAGNATPYMYSFVYTPSSAGSKTWYAQFQRVGGVNLSMYQDATILNQLIIEDIGTA